MATAGVPEAFRMLQAGDSRGALDIVLRVLAVEPANARAHLAAGIALRMGGRLAEARAALERAQQLDSRDPAPPYEWGLVAQAMGDASAALEAYDRSARLKPDFFAPHFAAGLVHVERREWAKAISRFQRVLELRPGEPQAQVQLALALAGAGQPDEADATFAQAFAAHPADADIARAYGQHAAGHGDFGRAAALFRHALTLHPGDTALPMYIAQCELLEGRWTEGWAAYAAREPRRQFERDALARGRPYGVPTLDDMRGRTVAIAGEQGLGDTLFFLRWAALLREAGARPSFSGDPRLHTLLARSGVFESVADPGTFASDVVVLAGDLPLLFPGRDPGRVASLRIEPLAQRVQRWRAELEAAGPRPWVGVAWRAGTPPHEQPHALSKTVPTEPLFDALGSAAGTLVAIQRAMRPGEIEAATRAARRSVHDLSRANDDLEDVLALVTLLDRHVAVSSTTLHLAAAAGAGADVLVPFPPEWRWRARGDSPWFPGFRVHRQHASGDWGTRLLEAARGQASGLQ